MLPATVHPYRTLKKIDNKEETISYKKELKSLSKRYNEMNEYLLELIAEHEHSVNELRYLYSFISYKDLNDEFIYFRHNAHEENDENLPFSYLTL